MRGRYKGVEENYKALSSPMVSETYKRITQLKKSLHHGKHIDAMTEKWLYHARKTRLVFQFSTPLPGTAQHFCDWGG